MKTTDLKNFKPQTKIVKMFNSPIFFELKAMDVEDIYEVLNMPSEEIQLLGQKLDTSDKRKFLVTLLQESQTFIEKVLTQCIVNYEDMEVIQDMLVFIPTQTKLEMMITVFDLSWPSIQSMLEQTEDIKDRVDMVIDFLKGLHYHNVGE